MSKFYIPIIGELWWAVVLRAHAHWLQDQGHGVMISCPKSFTYLFEDFKIQELPVVFKGLYKDCEADSMGLYRGSKRVPWEELQTFFSAYKPKGYEFSPYIKLTYIPRDKVYPYCLWKPFKINNAMEERKPFVIIFPRYRSSSYHAYRNLRKLFYINLIQTLRDESYAVVTMGSPTGAYDIDIDRPGYANLVGMTPNIKDVFEIAGSKGCICTIGGTSALTKMMGMLSPPVPSFVIGHELIRFTKEENFFNAKVGFYDVGGAENYQSFNELECISQIVNFVKDIKYKNKFSS